MGKVQIVVALIAMGSAATGFAQETASASAAAAATVTLQQCVDQALAAGPDVRLSNASLGIDEATYRQKLAANQLGLDATAGVGQNSTPVNSIPATGTSSATPNNASATAGLTLTGPLGLAANVSATHFLTEDSSLAQQTRLSANASANIWDGYPGGTKLADVRSAELDWQVNQASEADNRRTIIYEVKQAYYSLLAQQRQISILQSTLAQRQAETKKTQALYDAQSANQVELKQAQVNQRQAELDLLEAQDTLDNLRQQLSAKVGWPVDKAYAVAEADDLPAPNLTPEDAVKQALAQRSDIRQLQLSLQKAQITLDLTRGQATPTVSVTGGLDWTHVWTGPEDTLDLSAGLTVKAPIIDGGAAAAAIKASELGAEKLRIQEEQMTASITTSVRSALASLRNLVARADLAKRNLDLAQSQYDLTKIQFDSGVKSNLDVLTASVSLTTAQVAAAKARADAQLGVLALQNALGN
jgi:outer membrane protein TolC